MKNKMLSAVLAPGAVLAVAAGPAAALEAAVSKATAAAPEAVWAAVGAFCDIQTWHPAVEKCDLSEKDGATYRTLTLKGGGMIYEKLVAYDKDKHTYSYTIEDGVLPVQNYTSTLSVVAKDGGSLIQWSGKFDAKGASDEDAVKTMTGVYQGGVDALGAKVAK